MPISKYYKGHGTEVMKSMKKQYGPEKGEEVFYATANKEGMKPTNDVDVGELCRIVKDYFSGDVGHYPIREEPESAREECIERLRYGRERG